MLILVNSAAILPDPSWKEIADLNKVDLFICLIKGYNYYY